MAFYRFGDPGEDNVIHLRMSRKGQPEQCKAPRCDRDNPAHGELCGRMSTKLCDGPKCDIPICDLHSTSGGKNVDYCPAHAHLAPPKLDLTEAQS